MSWGWNSQDCGRVRGNTVGIITQYPGDFALAKNLQRRFGVSREKKMGGVCDAGETLVGTASNSRLTRPVDRGWQKPPRREKGFNSLARQLRRRLPPLNFLKPLLGSGSHFGIVGEKPLVPCLQNGEKPHDKNDPADPAA